MLYVVAMVNKTLSVVVVEVHPTNPSIHPSIHPSMSRSTRYIYMSFDGIGHEDMHGSLFL